MRHTRSDSIRPGRAALAGLTILLATFSLASQADAGPRRYRPHPARPVVVVHRDAPRYCWVPRPVIPAPRPVVVAPGPRWVAPPHIYVDRNPYYYRANIGLFIAGVAVDVVLGNQPPAGCAYYDPYCRLRFSSAARYGSHCRHHRHPLGPVRLHGRPLHSPL